MILVEYKKRFLDSPGSEAPAQKEVYMAVTRGTVTLRVIEAHFEEAFVDAPVNSTYCAVCVLEKTRWRRRCSQ